MRNLLLIVSACALVAALAFTFVVGPQSVAADSALAPQSPGHACCATARSAGPSDVAKTRAVVAKVTAQDSCAACCGESCGACCTDTCGACCTTAGADCCANGGSECCFTGSPCCGANAETASQALQRGAANCCDAGAACCVVQAGCCVQK